MNSKGRVGSPVRPLFCALPYRGARRDTERRLLGLANAPAPTM
jgi:hypothetical protein